MENEIIKKLDENAAKLEAIYQSTEKTRKYFLWVLIITIAAIVVPAIGLIFAIPAFLNNLNATIGL